MTGLTPDVLLRAYAVGLFPMAERHDDPALYWIDPEKRGILPLDTFKVPKRLRRTVRQGKFDIRCDTAFIEVMKCCAKPAPGRTETWINEPILELYGELFKMGQAHSVEAWREDRLVGGLYGVSLGGAFFGESMFSTETDSSKVALVHLVARLRKGGYKLLDTQFVTGHLSQFGAMEVHRDGYRHMLASALKVNAVFYRSLSDGELDAFLQSITQTS